MADETRAPKRVVEDLLAALQAEHGDEVWLPAGYGFGDDLRDRLAALILRERGRAFDLGVVVGRETGTNWKWTYERTAACRRKVVEGDDG